MLQGGVRLLVFQSHDMVFYPELQAAYPAAILTKSLGVDVDQVKIQSIYPFTKYFQKMADEIRSYPEQNFVFFLENFYHSSIYANKEIQQMLKAIADKNVYLHTLKTSEEDCVKLMEAFPQIKIIFRTDLEYFLTEFYKNGTPIEDIANLTFRKGDEIITTKKENVTYSLDCIIPAYENGIAFRDKESNEEIAEYCSSLDWVIGLEKQAMLTTGRGCRYKCSYCFRGVKFSSVRQIPLDVIESDLKTLKENGFKKIYFYDDCFLTTNRDRLDEIAELMKKYDFEYYIAIRYEMCSVETLEKLRGIKFYFLQIGLQSYKSMPHMKRNINIERFSNVLKTFNEMGAGTSIDIILGLPEDTPEDFQKTVDFAVSLKPSSIVMNTLFINPNTVLGDTYTDYGIKVRNVALNVPYMVESDTFDQDDMEECRWYVRTKKSQNPEIKFTIR